VLASKPSALVLIDGVFEAVPSVWHHELLAALASGTRVLGASSMGALRAAELADFGMEPIGVIANDYLEGRRIDDADVVLLHGDVDSGYRNLTLPLVNAEATLDALVKRNRLTRSEYQRCTKRARALFYKERTWRAIVEALPRSVRASRWSLFRSEGVDQKAIDARLALEVVRRGGGVKRSAAPIDLSSIVRRLRWGTSKHALSPRARRLAADGVRQLLLAEWARTIGVEVDDSAVRQAMRRVDPTGLSADQRAEFARVLALNDLIIQGSERFVSDGPSLIEGFEFQRRVRRAEDG
jgi:hypothetical protein